MARGKSEHTFCCCAIPLLNTGIYLTLLEQLVAGILIATLTLVAPPVVGVSIPSFTSFIFAGLLYLTAVAQLVGFFGVVRESTVTFRLYTILNTTLIVLDFALAAALIGVSAAKHNDAVTACENSFFPADAGTNGGSSVDGVTSGEGQSLCNIFAWVDIGIMGGIWLLLVIFQGYLLIITRFYSRDQLADHKRYYSIYSTTDDILMDDRAGLQPPYNPNPYSGDPWDARPDVDDYNAQGDGDSIVKDGPPGDQYAYQHARQASDASTIRGEQPQEQAYNTQPFRTEGYQSPPPRAEGYMSPPPQLPPIGAAPSQSGWNPVAEQRGIQQGDVPSEMGRYDRQL